ncbi:MAG: aminotransferase class III-fold pyridoxal phosphate-dependent enzyme [Bifidobacteriaceae bacterium]|nr:aminotransferase class III-fold pyridoxal phosphate-dependent enzyme [Bifidobacteriaceae bacterium]
MKLTEYLPYLSPALAKSTDLVVDRGLGSYLWDLNGRRYIDWVQGIAVNALGHCHPRVVKAVAEQAGKLLTASFNLVSYPTTLELARRLAEKLPGDLGSVFFSNGGAEAVDGAIKLARVATGRPGIVAFKGSFHGRTLGATAITSSSAKYRKGADPLMAGVDFVAYPSKDQTPAGLTDEERGEFALAQLSELFTHVRDPETVAAIIVEVVQGEGGYHVAPAGFLRGLREVTRQHGILLMFDEIQSGYGRTGRFLAASHWDVVPDIVTLGKALAGGIPASAIVSTPDIMAKWPPGAHGTTFGGNPLASAAGLAVLDEFDEADVIGNANTQGEYLASRLAGFAEQFSVVTDARGLGLMRAIELRGAGRSQGAALVESVRRDCLEHGLLLLSCGAKGDGIRIVSPLNTDRATLDEGLAILEGALDRAGRGE